MSCNKWCTCSKCWCMCSKYLCRCKCCTCTNKCCTFTNTCRKCNNCCRCKSCCTCTNTWCTRSNCCTWVARAAVVAPVKPLPHWVRHPTSDKRKLSDANQYNEIQCNHSHTSDIRQFRFGLWPIFVGCRTAKWDAWRHRQCAYHWPERDSSVVTRQVWPPAHSKISRRRTSARQPN